MIALEILPLHFATGSLQHLAPRGQDSWTVPAIASEEPGCRVSQALAERGLRTRALHSTSWRYEAGRVVLTYLAVLAAPAPAPMNFDDRVVARQPLARGSATHPPGHIAVAQVIEHALRHLCWLVQDDRAVRAALEPAWLCAVECYRPEPFRAFALNGDGHLLDREPQGDRAEAFRDRLRLVAERGGLVAAAGLA